MSRGPDTAPYIVRRIRVLPGGDSESQDSTPFAKFGRALEAAERLAADFFDDGDFAVSVFVIDRDGVAVLRARGERPADRPADCAPDHEVRRIA